MVLPKKHFVDIWDIDPEVLHKVVTVTRRVSQRMRANIIWPKGTLSAGGVQAKATINENGPHFLQALSLLQILTVHLGQRGLFF